MSSLFLFVIVLMALPQARPQLRTNASSTALTSAKVSDEDEGCPELRSKRYISDGKCASAHPILEVVCVDWYATSARGTTTKPVKKRCVDGEWHRRRIELLCHDGSRRYYHVRVVKSCRRQEIRRGRQGGNSRRARRLQNKRKP